MPKLTETWLRTLPEQRTDMHHWDSELKGFGLRARSSGRRTWLVKYRTRAGVQRKATLGAWPIVDAPEARRRAKALLGAVADGQDPAGAKAEEREKPTVADLAERYKTDHVLVKNKPTTAREFVRVLERQIVPEWGRYPVDEITTDHVAKLHHKLRRTPRSANHAIAVASKMFSLAERWRLRPQNSNPCRGLDRYPETRRTRFPSEKELSAIGAALERLTLMKRLRAQEALAFKLLALTGLRRGELLALKWCDVDLEEAQLSIRDAKAGAREHVVGAGVVDLLRSADQTSVYVVAGLQFGSPLAAEVLQSAWQKVRVEAKCPDLRMHDLRHGFGTYAAQTGANAFLVRDSLGHKTLAMTGRYVSRDVSPLRELADRVADRVNQAMRPLSTKEDAAQLAFDFA